MRPIPFLLFLCFFPGAPPGEAVAFPSSPAGRTVALVSSSAHDSGDVLPSPKHAPPGRSPGDLRNRYAPSPILTPEAFPAAGPTGRSLREIWNRFAPSAALPQEREPRTAAAPGHCVGNSEEVRAAAALPPWPWRQYGYELYFASSAELARSIYGLALETGDVAADMTLERFERGAQGFHYSLDQICRWAENLLSGRTSPRTGEERRLLDRLLLEGVLICRERKVVPGGAIHHVLGAAKGKKRSLADNLAHERLHVLWDEDKTFRNAGLSRWQALDGEEKQAVRASLPGYSPENEAQFVEEWTVREAEKLPPAQRKKLVGL